MSRAAPTSRLVTVTSTSEAHFFIEDRVASGLINVKYINTKDMIADFLTEPLMGSQFFKLRTYSMYFAPM